MTAFPDAIRRFGDGLAPALGARAQAIAEAVAVAAAAGTPVASGRLRAGWRVVAGERAARVVNDVPYAAAVEYGTARTQGRAMLRAAVAEAVAGAGARRR